LLLLPLLTGCVAVPLNEIVIPDEYYERESTIEEIYPATQEDVIRQLGEPDWIEKRRSSTYFIYQSVAYEYGVGLFVFYLASDEYCLFLKFDEANHLVDHISRRAARRIFHDCINEFYRTRFGTKYMGMLDQEIDMHCPNADLGHSDAQKRIGDLYYFGSFYIKKDLIHAYVWYTLAANGGDNRAAEQVDKLTSELSLGQLSKAQIQLDEWEPGQCERDLMKAIPEGY